MKIKNIQTESASGKKYFRSFAGIKYAIDVDAMKKLCLLSSSQNEKDSEITESYEWNTEQSELQLTNRIVRDTKTDGNPQNDMIIYDLIKLFVLRLLENAQVENDREPLDFSTSLSINTLVKCGVLVEIKE